MVKVKCPVCEGTGRVPWNFGGGGCWHIVQNPPNIAWQTNGIGTMTTSQSFTTTNCCYDDKICPACHGTGMQESGCCGCCKKCKRRACFDIPCPNPYVPFTNPYPTITPYQNPCPSTTSYAPFYQTQPGSVTDNMNYTQYTISCSTTPSSSSVRRQRSDRDL